jgi:hypothetical protein
MKRRGIVATMWPWLFTERREMSKPNVISIDGVNYVREDSIGSAKEVIFDKEPKVKEGPIKIVVLDKGFVYIGVPDLKDGLVTISNAYNIRYWGTTQGLGELRNGPTSKTKIDKVGTVTVPFHALISMIETDNTKWAL